MFEGEAHFYRNPEGEFIDFSKKRLQFWLETVPKDIRRIEYELWQLRREFINQKNLHSMQKNVRDQIANWRAHIQKKSLKSIGKNIRIVF